METKFHLRARAVVFQDGKFLVNRIKGQNYVFLPGGHVEVGESIPAGLRREIMEETGMEANIKQYLGAIEQSWTEGDVRQWEVNHFFQVDIPQVQGAAEIISKEPRYEYLWITPDEFATLDLLPVPVRELLQEWATGDRTIFWASDMNKKPTDAS